MPSAYLLIKTVLLCSHIRTLAADVNCPMPVIDIAHQHLLTARATHQSQGENAKHQTLDWSSVVAGNRLAAGLAPFDLHKVCIICTL